jgi:hypothetical protein
MAIDPHAAFTPAHIIDDPERFAGRQKELDAIADGLAVPGGHILIYGNRGIGKSSLAQQMILMAQNHATLTHRLTHKPFKEFDFLPFYIQCDDSLETVTDILTRLLTSETGLSEWLPFKVTKMEGTVSTGAALKLKVVEISGKGDAKATSERAVIDSGVVGLFVEALGVISHADIAKSGVLIVIDEFDRVKDKTGLASLMKSLDARIKLALVGVSTNVMELIGDHESIARQLTGGCVEVDPMSREEIGELFDRAEKVLEHEVHFPEETRDFVAKLANGHPFLVHVIGLMSSIAALRGGKVEVLVDDAQSALDEIALKGTAPIQESLYKKAVGHSYTREVVLKEFAHARDEEIRTTPVYTRIAEKLGLQDQGPISVYMGHLTSDRYGCVLERPRERYYRFRDSLFKAYAAARPYMHSPNTAETSEDA